MILRNILLVVGLVLTIVACDSSGKKPKPNIIYILADDLGYGDLGCYGQKRIETPNIDQLAKEGMVFTQHYSGAPVCAPSRCILLTGKHSGHAHIRGNDEWGDRGDIRSYAAMNADSTLEGQRPMPASALTIAEILKEKGYATGMVGKWGLGAPHTESLPTTQGFDFFCGYNCQRQAHTYYPLHLYKNRQRMPLNNKAVAPKRKLKKGANPLDEASYADYNLTDYSPDVMHQEMMRFVSDKHSQPFFLYWATPIPHVPIQAPQKWVDYYHEKFGDEKPYVGQAGYFPHRYPRAGYAAMVSYLDEQVGQLVEKLKELGVYENTLIVFTSDNGPTFNGGSDSPWFNSGGLFKSEKGWGKCYLQEGGIRVPMVVSWPGKVKPGSISDHVSAFWDVLPTFCELSDRKVPADCDGISFLPTLLGNKPQKEHPFLYWEYPAMGGLQAVRMGKWKAIRKNIFNGNLTLELYDLEADVREQTDVSGQYPQIVTEMEAILKQEHETPELERFEFVQLGD